jgi:FemAB-related protein (PEP-CTERM system-associated)
MTSNVKLQSGAEPQSITQPPSASGLTLIEPREDAAWDRFVLETEGGTFCHLAGWREVMAETLGAECLFRAAVTEEGRYEGLLPLVRVRSRIFGHYLVSMPFLNYGGPIGTPAAQRLLAGWAAEEARRSGADLLELRTRHEMPLGEQLSTSHRKITVVLDLPETVDTLWGKGFSSKLRSQIRRPQKEGMTARFGEDQVEAFYEVFSRNMRDLGTPVLPRLFFEWLPRAFPEQVIFGVIYHEDRPVAAGCGFLWGGEFEMTWASSLREYNRQAPNMLLYWSFMEEMIRDGAHLFNFGRCTPGEGTHRFKLQWGSRDLALPWAQWSPRGVDSTPSPDRPVFQLATAAWRRIPVGVANRVGPLLARQIP